MSVCPARSWFGGFGESAQQVAGVGGPDEPFGDGGVAFLVDPEAAAVHQP